MVTKEVFEKVSAIVGDKGIKPQRTGSFAEKCRLYGLYKRGTLGKLTGPFDDEDMDTDKRPSARPSLFAPEARSKYDAWAATQEMTKQEAMDEYCKLAEDIVGAPVREVLSQ